MPWCSHLIAGHRHTAARAHAARRALSDCATVRTSELRCDGEAAVVSAKIIVIRFYFSWHIKQ